MSILGKVTASPQSSGDAVGVKNCYHRIFCTYKVLMVGRGVAAEFLGVEIMSSCLTNSSNHFQCKADKNFSYISSAPSYMRIQLNFKIYLCYFLWRALNLHILNLLHIVIIMKYKEHPGNKKIYKICMSG